MNSLPFRMKSADIPHPVSLTSIAIIELVPPSGGNSVRVKVTDPLEVNFKAFPKIFSNTL